MEDSHNGDASFVSVNLRTNSQTDVFPDDTMIDGRSDATERKGKNKVSKVKIRNFISGYFALLS